MPTLTFTDGMSFDTDGPLRIEHRWDGFYVVGHGMLIPVASYEEGQYIIQEDEDRRREVQP
jgi:hypothetical protein